MDSINNPKVLIIDDEPDILKTLETILTREEFEVKAAHDCREAIAVFTSESFDLVITDIKMPGMDGTEVLREIKQLDEDMEVIILTGFASIESAVKTLRDDGAFDYLTKPLENIDELIHAVNRALEKRRLRLDNKKKTEELAKANEELRIEIEERKRLEGQLLEARKMEAIGTLAGGIAHDFNNLLMGIQGNASLMLLDVDLSQPNHEKLKSIAEYVRRGADLTKQLLGFARGGKYEVKPTDLNELIKNQNRMFGRTRKEITIREKYKKGLWAATVDQQQIEQVLLNLYINAWQAMPGGGVLYLQTENVALNEDFVKPFKLVPGKYVKISVADTGMGMNEAIRQRIFDPFFTTKEMGRGTGLGLASVYGIIMNHGGLINVYSKKGEGTTFNIYLPATESEVRDQKSEVSEDIRHGDEAVLLVDDDEMIVNVGKQMLEMLGYKVLTAGSGKKAIEIYKEKQRQIHIVILDMIMPDMSGGGVYDKMKEINPDVKVLLLSGYSIEGQATDILARGCNGFIQKPFKINEFSGKIRAILDNKV